MSDFRQHPDYLALLGTIIEHPDDDAPRLVIADWLEENEQPERAEFIRWQLNLSYSKLIIYSGGGIIDVSQLHHHSDQKKIGKQIGFDFLIGVDEATLHRGFIGEFQCTLGQWMKHGPELVRGHPVINVLLTNVVLEKEIGSGRCWYTISSMVFNDRMFQARSESPNEKHWLPKEFADYTDSGFTVRKIFASIQEAHEWLSRRAIEWAKLTKPHPEFTTYRPEFGGHF